MDSLRVTVLCQGKVVATHEFEDPREVFIADFNALNAETDFEAIPTETVFPHGFFAHPATPRRVCVPQRTCHQARWP